MSAITASNIDKRVVRTKKAIRAALFKLMETKEPSSITITELTSLANVNRRTFYIHYSNITDILDETESEIVEALGDIIRRFDSKNLAESTYTTFIELNRLITEDYGFYFRLMKSDFRRVLISRLKNVLQDSADKILGRFSITAESDFVFLFSSFINGGFLNLFMEWNKSERDISIESAAKAAGVMVDFCVSNSRKITEAIDKADFPENKEAR